MRVGSLCEHLLAIAFANHVASGTNVFPMNPIERFLTGVHEYRDNERLDTEPNDVYDVERPRTDIKETRTSFVVKLDIPGAKRDEIKVDISPNNILAITAQRRIERSGPAKVSPDLPVASPIKLSSVDGSAPASPDFVPDGMVKWHIHERRAPNYSRSFRLPSSIVRDAVKAKYVDGILTVTIPKADGTGVIDVIRVTVE